MKPLTESMKGIYFNMFGSLVHVNIAKTLIWARDTKTEREGTRRTYQVVTIEREDCEVGWLWSFIAGPFKVIIGKSR